MLLHIQAHKLDSVVHEKPVIRLECCHVNDDGGALVDTVMQVLLEMAKFMLVCADDTLVAF